LSYAVALSWKLAVSCQRFCSSVVQGGWGAALSTNIFA
jgi:hypothetical protein